MARGKFVAYYRVSTARQGRSGLGLEAQREAVETYLNGGSWKLVGEFKEIESGRKRDTDRPQLEAALSACRLYGATLVIAKFDRLYRNAAALLALRDSGIEFIAVDMPSANRLTVGIMALVAEETARQISANTKAALAAAKRRGTTLGNPQNLTPEGQARGNQASAEVRKGAAVTHARDIARTIAHIRASGVSSLWGIADELTRRGILTPRDAARAERLQRTGVGKAPEGCAWSAAQVSRVLTAAQ